MGVVDVPGHERYAGSMLAGLGPVAGVLLVFYAFVGFENGVVPAGETKRPGTNLPRAIFVSATPGPYELRMSEGEVTELVVRPTGLIDPPVEIRPVGTQVDDVLGEINLRVAMGDRVLAIATTRSVTSTALASRPTMPLSAPNRTELTTSAPPVLRKSRRVVIASS